MTILQAIILGSIQGLTEFLPVSSSGHLIFVPHLFGWADQGLTFDVIVHLGSLVAVVWYFRERLMSITKAFFSNKRRRMTDDGLQREYTFVWFIILSIIPALIVGLLFEFSDVEIRSSLVVALGLIGWGIILGAADIYSSRLRMHRTNITWRTALFIGCAQAIALIPGTSRSGSTMTAGLFLKLTKKDAAEFSFLMSVPVIAIAGALKTVQFFQSGGESIALLSLIVGFFAAAVSGYTAIWGLMKIIQKWSFMPFVVYRIVVGLLILFTLV